MSYLPENTFFEKLKLIEETSPSSQSNFNNSTYIDIDYSTIDYQPSEFATLVEYDFNFLLNKGSSSYVGLFIKLQYSDDNGNTWQDWGSKTDIFIGSDEGNIRLRGSHIVRFFLDVEASGSRSRWTNNRKLKLQAKNLGSSYTAVLNKLTDFYDDSGQVSGTWYFYPKVSCRSLKG